MSANEYHIGDFVYIEEDPGQPYLIRKIEELQKVSNEIGTVVKVTCLYRRRDIPIDLLKLADNVKTAPKCFLLSSSKKHQIDTSAKNEAADSAEEVKDDPLKVDEQSKQQFGGLPLGAENLSLEDLHCLQQHELFMSRQLQTLPAKNIRGKCCVVFLSDIDTPEMYIKNDDQYFYSLIYDKTDETLMSDKRTVSIGAEHQAIIDEPNIVVLKKLTEERKRKGFANIEDEPKPKKSPPSILNVPVLPNGRETLIFHPHHNLSDSEIDQFLILSKAVGTFARAFDVPSVTKIPTLHVAAAAASRDTTQFHAMSLLHQSGYNIGKASQYLVPSVRLYKNATDHILDSPSPLLCKDELEYWSPAEAHIFAEALEKCNKDFNEIRQYYLPWKSEKDIVEYYYMYKTSDQYAKFRKSKKDSLTRGNLKRVYILPYNKPSSSIITDLSSVNGSEKIISSIPCESCNSNESSNWFNWGPLEKNMRLCQICWDQWKKRGGLKRPHESERYRFEPYNCSIKPTTNDLLTHQRPRPSNSVSIFGINGQNGGVFIPPIATPCLLCPSSNISIKHLNRADKLFYYRSTILNKLARKLSTKALFDSKKFARNPFKKINTKAVMDNFFDRDPFSIVHVIRKTYENVNKIVSPSFIELIAKHCRSCLPASTGC
uniref:MTA n=1 Tax=Panagrolaimus sp. PS1159 TaxID=55785 RepID=A0AC35FDH6_9BILA